MHSFFGHVPFEAQTEPRGCGAACLAMAYRALGRPVPQSEIWPSVSRRNAFGSLASTTHLMARDAAERGHAAVAMQARDKLASLRACSDAGVHAILATRVSDDDPAGHYTLLLDVDSCNVRVHDPAAGPRRLLPHDDLLALWGQGAAPGEVTGGVLIAVGAPDPADRPCPACRTPVPASFACPRCRAVVGLRPLAAIGCISAACEARLWERLCCAECDLLFDPGDEVAAPAEAGPPEIKLGKVFAALDAFRAMALAVPGASAHPDLIRLMAELGEMQGKLADAADADAAKRAGVLVRHREAAAQVAARIEAVRATIPLPPSAPTALTLDAEALSRALLERLTA